MSPETGRIYEPEEIERLPKTEREKLIVIPPGELSKVIAMSRPARKRWLKRNNMTLTEYRDLI